MALGRHGLRLGLIVGAMFAVSVTVSTTSASTNVPDRHLTTSADAWAYGLDMVMSHQPSVIFDLRVADVREGAGLGIKRQQAVYRPMAIKPRASGAAVRPTSLAGWRSGHVGRLAA